MGIIEWATSPWGQDIPIHIAFSLIWVVAIGGLAFLIGHAIWLKFQKADEYSGHTSASVAARIPAKVPRHSLAARLFHWIMAMAITQIRENAIWMGTS